jgi:hypothetical protein
VLAPIQRNPTEKDAVIQALAKVLAGHSFRSSNQCQALLRYIVEHSLAQENEMLRERVIGIQVFGRAPDYDSGNDPVVRARAAEVRKRLAQHYTQGDGASEELRIEIPSGSYRAIFAARESYGVRHDTDTDNNRSAEPDGHISDRHDSLETRSLKADIDSPREKLDQPSSRQPRWISNRWTAALAALAMLTLAYAAGYFATARRSASQRVMQGVQSPAAASDDPVTAFWAPFIKQDHSPIIGYADAMFLIDGAGDLFRFRHGAADNRGAPADEHLAHQFASNPSLVASAGPLSYDNGYTGTGDLRAMAMLITQLAHQGATPLVKSSYDISADDLKQHNVILLGSSAENLAVAQLVSPADFSFTGPVSNRDPWSDQILNSQPQSGEQPKYSSVRDPVSHVLQQDYALVSFQPGVVPEHQIVILGGIDTTGTEGAALLVTSEIGVEELTSALTKVGTLSKTAKSGAFQALVRVDVKKGYQVLGSHLVTMHPMSVATH